MNLRLMTAITMGVLLSGCTREPEPAADDGPMAAAAPSNRVDIPQTVRQNLGITFVTVERRDVEHTLRVPGVFEFMPTARREYRTVLPGRVELLVDQFERVEADQVLYRIESLAWRERQQTLTELDASIRILTARLDNYGPQFTAHDEHERSLETSLELWRNRAEQLEAVRDAGGVRIGELAQARASLSQARADLAEVREKAAELKAARAEATASRESAIARRAFLLNSTASLLSVSPGALDLPVSPDDPTPRWATIDAIEVRAGQPGVVETLGLTNGAWADQTSVVLTVVQPDRLRFHAQALQSDLGALRDGLAARIVPPTPTRAGRAVDLVDTMSGLLALGLAGDPQDRTVDLYLTPEFLSDWARPGVSAQLEIVTDSTGTAEIAVPLAAVQRDGIMPVLFRRDPSDASKAIRLDADLGLDDGRWVTVLSGLRDGDEVVLDGAFQLMLATSGSVQAGGHFHSDGTFHDGEH